MATIAGASLLSLPTSVCQLVCFSVLAEIGWRAEFLPADHALSDFEFDVIIGADGRRNTLEGEYTFLSWDRSWELAGSGGT